MRSTGLRSLERFPSESEAAIEKCRVATRGAIGEKLRFLHGVFLGQALKEDLRGYGRSVRKLDVGRTNHFPAITSLRAGTSVLEAHDWESERDASDSRARPHFSQTIQPTDVARDNSPRVHVPVSRHLSESLGTEDKNRPWGSGYSSYRAMPPFPHVGHSRVRASTFVPQRRHSHTVALSHDAMTDRTAVTTWRFIVL